jgi:hypothetical protein
MNGLDPDLLLGFMYPWIEIFTDLNTGVPHLETKCKEKKDFLVFRNGSHGRKEKDLCRPVL